MDFTMPVRTVQLVDVNSFLCQGVEEDCRILSYSILTLFVMSHQRNERLMGGFFSPE